MNKLWVSMISMLVTAAGTMPALAQTGDAGYELEEVVVTAELREVNLQKVATSIQVTSGEELRKEGKKRIDEIMAGAVGIQTQDSQNGVSFFVRGVDSGGVNGVSSTPVLVDGVAQSRGEAVRGGTLDLARAEVMRGPQSTTLGANALSGAVSLVSNKPVFQYEASTSLDVGNYHNATMEGVMNVPLADNQAVRVAYSSQKRDSYYSNGAGDSDLTNLRLKYRWQPSNTLDMTATFSHQNIGGNGVNQLTLLTYGRYMPWIGGTNALAAATPGTTLNKFSICQNSTTDATLTSGGAFPGDCSVPGSVVQPQNSLTFVGCTPVYPTPATATVSAQVGLGKLVAIQGGNNPDILGCAPAYYPLDDGTNFRTRSNAWDDGSKPHAWSNDPYRNSNIEQASVQLDWTTDYGTVTFLPSYQSTHYTALEPYRTYQAMGTDQYQRTKIGDLRMNSPTGDKLTWQTGLYYSDDRTNTISSFANLPGAGMGGMGTPAAPTALWAGYDPGYCGIGVGSSAAQAVNASNGMSATDPAIDALLTTTNCYNYQLTPHLDRINKALYFNAEYSLLDTVRLIGGARYNDQTLFQSQYNIINGDQNGPYATCSGLSFIQCNGTQTNGQFRALDNLTLLTNMPFRSRWTHTTYRGGVEWDVLPETMLYAVISTGFNPGAADAMATTNAVNPAVTLQQISAGWKSQALDNRLQFNGEAFLTTYRNRAVDGNVIAYAGGADSSSCSVGMGNTQIVVPNFGSGYCMGLGTPIVDKFETSGIDLDLTWLLSPTDRIAVTGEYLYAVYKDAPTVRCGFTNGCNGGATSAPAVYLNGTINPNYIKAVGLNPPNGAPITLTDAEAAQLAASFDTQLQGFVNSTLQNAPRFSATWSYSHNFLLANGSRVTPRISGAYKTRYWSLGGGGPGGTGVNVIMQAANDPSNPFYLAWQKAYATWDSSVAWDKADGKFTVTGYVKNLTNEVVLGGYTFQYVSINAPRTYGATFVANF